MAYIVAIDPGPTESAYVILKTGEGYPGKVMDFGKCPEYELRERVTAVYDKMIFPEIYLAIEFPASYGMAVGKTVFETCAVVGRLEEYFYHRMTLCYMDGPRPVNPSYRVYRKRRSDVGVEAVSMAICNNNRANDANVRQAIIDLYPATGGGRIPQIGLKNSPGPLYGISKDVWAALGVALTFQQWIDKQEKKNA